MIYLASQEDIGLQSLRRSMRQVSVVACNLCDVLHKILDVRNKNFCRLKMRAFYRIKDE